MNPIEEIKGILLKLFFTENVVKINLKKGFSLKGGKKSPLFFDSGQLESTRRDLICILMGMSIKDKPDSFVGVVSGGISWAGSLASNFTCSLHRAYSKPKKHSLCNQIGGEIRKGEKVVVIDDVVTTGESALSVIRALKEENAKVKAFICIFDWGFPEVDKKFEDEGIEKISLFTLKDVLDFGKEGGYLSEQMIEAIENFYQNNVA